MSTTSTAPATRIPTGSVVAGAIALGVLIILGVLAATGGAAQPTFGDPGPVVRWGLPIANFTWQIAAVATLGLLGAAAFLMPERGTTRRRAIALSYAVRTGVVWVTSAVIALVLTFADLVGAAPTSTTVLSQFGSYVFSLEITRVPAISILIALVVTIGAAFAASRATMAWLSSLALLAIVMHALTGHAASAEGHEEAVNAMGFHLLGVAVWVGGLAALFLMRRHLLGDPSGERSYPGDLAATVERYSTLALWAYVAVALSGLQSGWLRVGSFENLATAYGLLLAGKTALLIALGVLGWQQRRRVVTLLRENEASRSVFARLASLEVFLMAAAMGLGVALARTAPPGVRDIPPRDVVTSLTGYPDPGPMTTADLFVTWRIDWLFLTMALVAIGLYLAGVRRLHKRGDRWPWLRTVLWITGWLVFIYATCGALAIWGRVLFSTHMVMHMLVAMFVPLLLVPGAPITLALRALPARKDKTWGPRELILQVTHSRLNRVLTMPVVAAVLFFVSMAIFYYSPTFELALTTHTGHLLMMFHFLLTGYLFTWVLIGIDPGPKRWPPLFLLVILFVTISFHAFFGVILTGTEYLLAPDFYGVLNLPWLADPLADQFRAGEIAWGVGELPTLILALMVAVNWVRQDKAETTRKDRQARRDGDADLAAYNEMLAERRRRSERMGG